MYAEGAVSYIDPDNVKAHWRPAASNGMQGLGRGMWHRVAGSTKQAGRAAPALDRLATELELGPTLSIYQALKMCRKDGPTRVLTRQLMGPRRAPSCPPRRTNYARGTPEGRRALALRAPMGHTVLWTAVAIQAPYRFPTSWGDGDLAAFRAVDRNGRVPRRRPTLNSFSARPSPHKYDLRPRLPLGPHNGRRVA